MTHLLKERQGNIDPPKFSCTCKGLIEDDNDFWALIEAVRADPETWRPVNQDMLDNGPKCIALPEDLNGTVIVIRTPTDSTSRWSDHSATRGFSWTNSRAAPVTERVPASEYEKAAIHINKAIYFKYKNTDPLKPPAPIQGPRANKVTKPISRRVSGPSAPPLPSAATPAQDLMFQPPTAPRKVEDLKSKIARSFARSKTYSHLFLASDYPKLIKQTWICFYQEEKWTIVSYFYDDSYEALKAPRTSTSGLTLGPHRHLGHDGTHQPDYSGIDDLFPDLLMPGQNTNQESPVPRTPRPQISQQRHPLAQSPFGAHTGEEHIGHDGTHQPDYPGIDDLFPDLLGPGQNANQESPVPRTPRPQISQQRHPLAQSPFGAHTGFQASPSRYYFNEHLLNPTHTVPSAFRGTQNNFHYSPGHLRPQAPGHQPLAPQQQWQVPHVNYTGQAIQTPPAINPKLHPHLRQPPIQHMPPMAAPHHIGIPHAAYPAQNLQRYGTHNPHQNPHGGPSRSM